MVMGKGRNSTFLWLCLIFIILVCIFVKMPKKYEDGDFSLACTALETECFMKTQRLIKENIYDMSLIADCFAVLEKSGCDVGKYKLVFGAAREHK